MPINHSFSITNDKKLVVGWVAICLFFSWLAWQPFHNQGLDYSLYYSIGELFPAGQGKDIFVSGEQGPFYGYSPFVAPLFTVFQWVPLRNSIDLFFILKIFSLCLWPFLLSRCAKGENSNAAKYVFGAVATLVILPAIYEETIVGNINTFLLTMMFAAFALTQFGYFTTAASIITLVAAFKPQYSLFFIPVLIFAPKKAILGGLVTMSLLISLSIIIYGYSSMIALTIRWLEMLATPLAAPSDVNNMSTSGVVIRMLSQQDLYMSGDLQHVNLMTLAYDQSSFIAKGLGFIFVAGIFAALIRRWRARPEDRLLDLYAGITLITLFATPVIWLTHYMFLVVPIFAIFNMHYRNHKKLAAGTIGFAAIAYFLAGQMLNNPPQRTILARTYGMPFYALIGITILYVLTWREAKNAA